MVATGRRKRPCNWRLKRSAATVMALALPSAWRGTPTTSRSGRHSASSRSMASQSGRCRRTGNTRGLGRAGDRHAGRDADAGPAEIETQHHPQGLACVRRRWAAAGSGGSGVAGIGGQQGQIDPQQGGGGQPALVAGPVKQNVGIGGDPTASILRHFLLQLSRSPTGVNRGRPASVRAFAPRHRLQDVAEVVMLIRSVTCRVAPQSPSGLWMTKPCSGWTGPPW